MWHFHKQLPDHHPAMKIVLDSLSWEGKGIADKLAALIQENGAFELDESVLQRNFGFNIRKAKRILPILLPCFEELLKAFQKIPKDSKVSQSLPKFENVSESFPKLDAQNPHGSTRDLREEEIREEKKTSSQRMLRSTDEQMAIAVWMSEKIRDLNPSSKEPNFSAWANEIRLMVESDKRSLAEIKELFTWVQSDSFWRTNILSPGKLREKWDQLQIKRRNPVKIANFPQKSTAVDGRNIVAGADREYISSSFKDYFNTVDGQKGISNGSA